MLRVFTIVARNYLSLALTLGDSLKKIHPNSDFRIVVADGTADIDAPGCRHRLEKASDYLGDLHQDLAFKYNVTEFCTAIKPFVFKKIAEEAPGQPILYLDPDILVLNRLDPVLEALQEKSICLTPHLLECRPGVERLYPEHLHLWEGIFNLGFCGIRADEVALKFIDWWKAHLQTHCYADRWDGLHTDQKWADYVPVYFGDSLHILRHPGCNVAHWNLDERHLSQEKAHYSCNGHPLLFFHFSGFDFKEGRLTKHSDADFTKTQPDSALPHLAREYRKAVLDNGYEKYIRLPYLYAFFDNGTAITPLHRRLYRKLDTRAPSGNPFLSTGPFFSRLQSSGLIDHSTAAHRGYSSASLARPENADFRARKLLRWFFRLLGVRYYALLVKAFARYGRFEAHDFLLKP